MRHACCVSAQMQAAPRQSDVRSTRRSAGGHPCRGRCCTCKHAAGRPHVDRRAVQRAAEQQLRGPVPPRKHLRVHMIRIALYSATATAGALLHGAKTSAMLYRGGDRQPGACSGSLADWLPHKRHRPDWCTCGLGCQRCATDQSRQASGSLHSPSATASVCCRPQLASASAFPATACRRHALHHNNLYMCGLTWCGIVEAHRQGQSGSCWA